MKILNKNIRLSAFIFYITIVLSYPASSQSITGVWRGKITQHRFGLNKIYQLELKLIRNGDSLTGTSYYFSSENNYYRYAVKGYFDPSTGYVVWWDEQLVETISPKTRAKPTENGLRYAADFNCPGEGIMKLDGNAERINETQENPLVVHLNKMPTPIFSDEWDFVIDNFPLVANDPALIDSIETLQASPPVVANVVVPDTIQKKEIAALTPPENTTRLPEIVAKKTPEANPVLPEKKSMASAPQTIVEKFVARKKSFVTEIPVSGDSIELNFYDHAEIDGDSISLFLNNKLIQEHILLKA